MLLTIIVPSYNQNRYLGRTLDSIFAQSYRPVEVIVVDGASIDGTIETLVRYASMHPELRWTSEPDDGPAAAVNKGLAMAHGEVSAIQSSDDIYYAGAFEAVMPVFQHDKSCGFVIGDYSGIDENDDVLYNEAIPDFSWEAYFARSMALPQSSIFFRTLLGQTIGGWNGKYYCCDTDFWMRLLLRTRAAHVKRVLSGWRIYAGQRTHAPEARAKIWEGYWRMIEDSEDLRTAHPRIRRLAFASRHLRALRYYPIADSWTVRRHLLIGFLQHPTFWRYYPWSISRWFPGMELLRRLGRHVMRPAVP